MNRERWTVRRSDGKTKVFRQHAHDNHAEFSGWAWCAIEEWITGKRVTPCPAGTEITIHVDREGTRRYRSTGNPIVDRWECIGVDGYGVAPSWVK